MEPVEPFVRVAFRARLGAFALDAAFAAPAHGVTALFGPSGCGKSSVLRAIAGLLHCKEGYCAVGEQIWQDAKCFRPSHRRAIGYVFQDPGLFPHLSVRGNLRYGLQPGAISFDEMVAFLRLEPLLSRMPRHLSGGERQRVAIGRALLSQPRLLLLDEPLSALDQSAKLDILSLLERLCAKLSLPVIHVSHDLREVERLADHLVLMDQGRVVAAGALATLQSDIELPLAQTPEAAVVLSARVTARDDAYGLARLAVDGAELCALAPSCQPGERCRVRIAASDVSLARARLSQNSILNALPARVLALRALACETVALLGLGEHGEGARILARITRRSCEGLALAPGLLVYAHVKGVVLEVSGKARG